MKITAAMSLTGFFLFVLTGNVFGKDTKTTEFERIRHSEEYVCGLGIGETLQDAQEMAVKELASQISISVSVNYAHQYEETEEEFHDRVKSNMESFTGVTLNNAKSLVDKVESKGNIQWQVLRYIYNVPQISDRELSQKKTITLHRNGKDNTKKVHPGVQGQGCLGGSERIVNQG